MAISGAVLPVGDAAVLAVLGDTIDPQTVASVWSLFAVLKRTLRDSVLDIVPAYASVLVRFNPSATQLAAVMASVRGAMEAAGETVAVNSRTIDVGVCFAPEHALDLDDVVTQTGLAPDEVIEEFCKPTYRVAFLGFNAGFPYMIGLSKKLDLPRLPSPRVRVPAGSVAFTAGQCGIYPRSSPGGWRILGKTSAQLFDPASASPALFSPGDAVRFHVAPSVAEATASVTS
jgi:KipI family sensor histidine kinase inhibitor